jgi:hypothetical protein
MTSRNAWGKRYRENTTFPMRQARKDLPLEKWKFCSESISKNGERLATKTAEPQQQSIRWRYLICTDDNGRSALEFAGNNAVKNESIVQRELWTLFDKCNRHCQSP